MIRNLIRRLSGIRHAWSYRNPYDRTCTVCRRHEVAHTDGRAQWWEVFCDGSPELHKETA